jgi:hypothetical protein
MYLMDGQHARNLLGHIRQRNIHGGTQTFWKITVIRTTTAPAASAAAVTATTTTKVVSNESEKIY